jgi:hypothetical protein
MSKHTPGPWKVTTHATDPNAYDVEAESGGKITRGYWGRNAKADARLIAAAPELLNAANQLVSAIWGRDIDRTQESLGAAEVAIRAAIAKAEGR